MKQIETVPITNSHAYYQAYYGVSTLYWKVVHDGDQISLNERSILSNSIASYCCQRY